MSLAWESVSPLHKNRENGLPRQFENWLAMTNWGDPCNGKTNSKTHATGAVANFLRLFAPITPVYVPIKALNVPIKTHKNPIKEQLL